MFKYWFKGFGTANLLWFMLIFAAVVRDNTKKRDEIDRLTNRNYSYYDYSKLHKTYYK